MIVIEELRYGPSEVASGFSCWGDAAMVMALQGAKMQLDEGPMRWNYQMVNSAGAFGHAKANMVMTVKAECSLIVD